MTQGIENKIDELTGGSYIKEKLMYMRYHHLTNEQAEIIMNTKTHKERDDLFMKMLGSNNG